MGGLVVCAFFALGVMTGFSTAGRAVALRASASLTSYRDQILDSLAPARTTAASYSAVLVQWAGRAGIYHRGLHQPGAAAISAGDMRDGAIAIVERHDGFYQLFSGGELRGPVSPDKQGDLPVLSGDALDNARGSQMVDYAAAAGARGDATVRNYFGDARRRRRHRIAVPRARAHRGRASISIARRPNFSARSKCVSNGRDVRT